MSLSIGYNITTHYYMLDEIVSCLQKSIRRNDYESALFCAFELCRTGRTGHCWKRLLVITFEDLGYFNIDKIIYVCNAFLKYKKIKGKDKITFLWKNVKIINLIRNCVYVLCQGKKNRIADHIAHIIAYMKEKNIIYKSNDVFFKNCVKNRNEAIAIKHFSTNLQVYESIFKNKYTDLFELCSKIAVDLKAESILVYINLMLIYIRRPSSLEEECKIDPPFFQWENYLLSNNTHKDKYNTLKVRSYFTMGNDFRDKHTLAGMGTNTLSLIDTYLKEEKIEWITAEEKSKSFVKTVKKENSTRDFFYRVGAVLKEEEQIYNPYLPLLLKAVAGEDIKEELEQFFSLIKFED